MQSHTLVLCLLVFSCTLRVRAASYEETATLSALEDEIDAGVRQASTLEGYSDQLQHALARAGYPSGDLIRSLSPIQRLERALPPRRYDSAQLEMVLQHLLRNIGLRARIDWAALAEMGVTPTTLVSGELEKSSGREALRRVMNIAGGSNGGTWVSLNGDTIWITTYEQYSKYVATRAFDISHLLTGNQNVEDAGEQLILLISETVAPDSWKDAGGSAGSIGISGARLMVTQTPDNLAAVASLLDQLDTRNPFAGHRRSIVENQQQIVALNAEIDRLTARCRSLGIRPPPPLERAMNLPLPELEFVAKPLRNCFETLAAASGQVIDVKWDDLQAAQVGPTLPVTIDLSRQTLSNALRLLLAAVSTDQNRLQYDTANSVITVATQKVVDQASIVTRVYEISPLIAGANRQEKIDRIIHIITDNFEPDSWRDAGGSSGALREVRGQLVVTQTIRVQARIKALVDRWMKQHR